MKLIDKAMKKHGYNKVVETRYGVRYRKREPQNFDHAVCILHKASGGHMLQQYDEKVHECEGDFINCVCGVEIPVLLLMWLKAKYLSFKFGWWAEGR